VKDLPSTIGAAAITSPVHPRGHHILSRRQPVVFRLLLALIIGGIILVGWGLLARASDPSILPAPTQVWARFVTALSDGTYLPALVTTAEEAIWGWLIAAAIALPLGYLIGLFRALEDTIAPYLAGSQAMPIVAIAPLLVVWLGFGALPKIVVCALIAFFPMLATTASGVRGVPSDLRDAARVFGAGGLSLARYVDLPLAARTIFAGMKVAAALAVTGAVVGEFVSSDQGLGFLLLFGRENFDTPLMFVALISLMALGALTYTAVSLVERFVLRWDD
jgi:NitT/TauT family transport system permease protein